VQRHRHHGRSGATESQKKLIDMGMIPGAPRPPAELASFLAREVATWGKVVRQAGAAGIE
jgi:tripartite-type tricarboxylate transporter receptor subunit TctC